MTISFRVTLGLRGIPLVPLLLVPASSSAQKARPIHVPPDAKLEAKREDIDLPHAHVVGEHRINHSWAEAKLSLQQWNDTCARVTHSEGTLGRIVAIDLSFQNTDRAPLRLADCERRSPLATNGPDTAVLVALARLQTAHDDDALSDILAMLTTCTEKQFSRCPVMSVLLYEAYRKNGACLPGQLVTDLRATVPQTITAGTSRESRRARVVYLNLLELLQSVARHHYEFPDDIASDLSTLRSAENKLAATGLPGAPLFHSAAELLIGCMAQ